MIFWKVRESSTMFKIKVFKPIISYRLSCRKIFVLLNFGSLLRSFLRLWSSSCRLSYSISIIHPAHEHSAPVNFWYRAYTPGINQQVDCFRIDDQDPQPHELTSLVLCLIMSRTRSVGSWHSTRRANFRTQSSLYYEQVWKST